MQLTTKRVAMFAKRPGRYHDGHGLILVVVNPNNASWQLRYQRNGRERQPGGKATSLVCCRRPARLLEEATIPPCRGLRSLRS